MTDRNKDTVAVLVLPEGTTHYAIKGNNIVLLKDACNLGMMYYNLIAKDWVLLGWDSIYLEPRPVELIAKYIKKD